jgi:hypothetical protein
VPSVNPFIAATPALAPAATGLPGRVLNQAPASTGPYTPLQGAVVNPYQGTVNDTNAAGTQEAVAAHVAVIIIASVVGVFVLRALSFKFVVAAGVGGAS